MKRFQVGAAQLYYDSIEDAKREWPEYDVYEIDDTAHEKYLPLLTSNEKVKEVAWNPRVLREYYQITTQYGKFAYILSKDPKDGRYYEIVHSRFAEYGKLFVPCTWCLQGMKSFFYSMSILQGEIEFSIRSINKPGQKERPARPAELKGLKPIGTAYLYGGRKRGSIQVFVCGNDVYLNCSDYFSPSYRDPKLTGTPLSVRANALGMPSPKNKFVYEDNWGDIVLRRRAWVQFTELATAMKLVSWKTVSSICEQAICRAHGFTSPLSSEWRSALESICRMVADTTNKKREERINAH